MTKLESLQDIKLTALYIQDSLLGSDLEKVRIAESALEQLVERFYAENEDYMSPQQYRACKRDYEYFMVLLEMAMEYWRGEGSQISKE